MNVSRIQMVQNLPSDFTILLNSESN